MIAYVIQGIDQFFVAMFKVGRTDAVGALVAVHDARCEPLNTIVVRGGRYTTQGSYRNCSMGNP
jgi:hypothetical protein